LGRNDVSGKQPEREKVPAGRLLPVGFAAWEQGLTINVGFWKCSRVPPFFQGLLALRLSRKNLMLEFAGVVL